MILTKRTPSNFYRHVFFLDWPPLYLEYVACMKDIEASSHFNQETLYVDKANLTLEKCMKHCAKYSYVAVQVCHYNKLNICISLNRFALRLGCM